MATGSTFRARRTLPQLYKRNFDDQAGSLGRRGVLPGVRVRLKAVSGLYT